MINRLAGAERQSVKTILEDGRGRHTTTARSLIALPAGGLLIDTPGMRELQLWASEGSLESAFVEIDELAAQCRFRDCLHETEPGCAVLQALASGELPAERHESFLKLRGEIAYMERKQDVSARIELKRKWKIINKRHRQRKKNDEKF